MDSTSDGERVEQLLQAEEWAKAEEIIRANMDQEPEHWWLTRLSDVSYEQHRYEEALDIIEKARRLAPKCPLVLWDYAGTLDMLGRKEEAIGIWQSLLRRGLQRLAFGECGEGIRWTKSLLNDCLYRIGMSYHRLGKNDLAVQYLRKHLDRRQPGIPSLYSLREVRKELREIKSN